MGKPRNLAALLDTSGDVVADALDNAGGGGAWEVISSTTLTSSATSVDFSLSGYDTYMLIGEGVKATPASGNTASTPEAYFSKDSGSTWENGTEEYSYATTAHTASSSGIYDSHFTNNKMIFSGLYVKSNAPSYFEMKILTAEPSTVIYEFVGHEWSATSISSMDRTISSGINTLKDGEATDIRFQMAGTASLSAGTFTLYGLKTS